MVKFSWDKLKRFLAQANTWTGQQTFSNIAVTGGTIGGATITENLTTSTDPDTNAAVTTAIVNSYNGVVVTLTAAGNTQTIQNPTTAATIRKFMVVNNDTSTHNLPVVANSVTFTLTPGEGQCFIWDGSAWGPTDLGITDIPVLTTQGGTGRATGTTAYSLVATGTTATGAQQTLANGATTEVLVGGGASALPVWTEATGTGAPVRATSPTLVTPVLGTPASGDLQNCTAATTTTKGVVELATVAEDVAGASSSVVSTPAGVAAAMAANAVTQRTYDCQNLVEDLSFLPPVTFVWNPGSLADGVGETSAAVSYPGATLGGVAVQAIAPYDLQGITCNAYADAANSCKVRLQNESGGTIDLASGTWTLQARRI